MPKLIRYSTNHIKRAARLAQDSVYSVVGQLQMTAWCTREPVAFAARRSGKRRRLAVGDAWGELFDCAWFNFRGKIPRAAAGQRVVLLIDLNGEACVVDRAGVPLLGLTNKTSEGGEPGKKVVPVTTRARGGEAIDLWADAGCNDLFGNLKEGGVIKEASVAVMDEEARQLHFDFNVLTGCLDVLPEKTARRQQILAALDKAANIVLSSAPIDVAGARRALAPALAMRGGDPSFVVSAVGQSHMDLAWLWPIRETMRKGARTFATALAFMERYPDYIFSASQPQLFQWVKEQYPELYAKVRRKVAERRWEPQGAMWVEADCNIPCGESLVRQILHGKRFFREEFGVDVRCLWLPDTFGFNAALPQLMKRSGLDWFMTIKMSWNRINTIPHHSFTWQGLDGSTVLAHIPPEGLNSSTDPATIAALERDYADKDVSGRAMLLFGTGDGGGGPGETHLERLERLKNFSGLPRVRQERSADFFRKWSADADHFQTWVGELYLERHEGTLTTQGRSKWFNRRMEQALRDWEWASVLAGAAANAAYPAGGLRRVWRETLLYQFHDILPGSSIKRVYDESIPRYQSLLAEAQDGTARNLAAVTRRIDTSPMKEPVVFWNSLSWDRTEWVRAAGNWRRITVPSMGYTTVDAAAAEDGPARVSATGTLLENELLRVRFAKDGAIVSIYDKAAKREVLAKGGRGNRLAVYRDDGDAWDFPLAYADMAPRHMRLVAADAKTDGPCAVVRQTYTLGHSTVTQSIGLTAGSRRLDFETSVVWRETNAMLRTSFPVAVRATEACCEIQFGFVRRPTHRNTSWDLAKDEVPAQKWVDLSTRDYGVALLNDSKYGHRIKGHVIDLNLLRSVRFPGQRVIRDEDMKPGRPHDGFTDQADHSFTYALYPHPGDHVEGGVVRQGYELNVPLLHTTTPRRKGGLPPCASLLSVDAPEVVIEAVKKAEDDGDVVVRLYESTGGNVRTRLRVGLPVASANETDLMEEHPKRLNVRNGTVELAFHPFEIKTVKLGLTTRLREV